MRILVAALAVALLAGCTTPSDLRNTDPVFTASTLKSPKQYALCVLPKWQDLNAGASMSETETGYRLILANPGVGQTDEVLEVSRTQKGSMVKHFQRIAWQQLGRGAVSEAVRSCI
jgi:outer membrane biogenesis lipoprotein LolB